MSVKRFASNTWRCLRIGLASLALFQFTLGASLAGADPNQGSPDNNTRTPIKHVIVIIGENRSFDHVFATYVPKPGQQVLNLLSEGIVNSNGTPGPNFRKAEQKAAVDQAPDAFLLSPDKVPFPGAVLPAPLVGGPKDAASYIPGNSLALAMASESGLPSNYYPDLVAGGALLTTKTPDTRITNVTALPPGPFQLTNGKTFFYDYYAASPVHRFYQMWQQLDCSSERATFENPSGCDAGLFPWVEVATGAGSSTQLNGLPQPPDFSTEYGPSPTVTTGEGSTAMGFYNVQQGDVPYFKSLADAYAMSDNFHQSVNGGTGANHIMLGHGDAIWFSDGNGNPEVPPHNVPASITPATFAGPGLIDEIENPDPAQGTNNWYTQDGYGSDYNAGYPMSEWDKTQPNKLPIIYGGGSYSNCSDPNQHGVKPILDYLRLLHIESRCEPGHYYLLNNYNPGWFGNGNNAYIDQNPSNTPFTIPPSSTPSIGDDLNDADVSWKYYGDMWNNYVNDPYELNWSTKGPLADEYCNICNPFQYDTSIMSNPAQVAAHIQDTQNLYSDIANGTLPAVSFVKPSGYVDGHPSSSKLDLFEGFVKNIVDQVEASPTYTKDTV